MARETGELVRPEDRIWTVPNLLSFLRLLGVPLFLYLVLVPEADGWALAVLAFAGISDYLDGQIARRFPSQGSRIGALLDPAADRLYIVAVTVGLLLREIIPIWLAVVLLARDLLLLAAYPTIKRLGYPALPVHFLGKAATLCLMYGFPLLLLGDSDTGVARVATVTGWAFTWWGTALYWWAGLLYLMQVRQLVRGSKVIAESGR
ncbi:MAG TPA: CDP-alcohol phosphatidyltransferase family protein [Actinomycetes bacterium]|nr:CDP-alcohol phosphatidyltransferase family protein [Actinomycetes bacterium]